MFDPYFRAAYHHMWVEPKKMDDPATFRDAFMASGIDIDRLIARAQQDDVKKKLIEDTTDAVDRGAFGSPTFFVGREMFFGKDQLRDVEKDNHGADRSKLRSRIGLKDGRVLDGKRSEPPQPRPDWRDGQSERQYNKGKASCQGHSMASVYWI